MINKILLLLLVIFILCGCSGNRGEETITFSSWGSVSEVKIIKKIISDFEKENPDIKINFIHIPQNYFQKIHLLFASNTAPDVVFINNIYLPVYAAKLEDLTDIVRREDFYPQSTDGLSYEGKVLAIPRDISNLVFYVNLDLLKSKGLELPDKNWRIEDLLEYALKLTDENTFGVSYEEGIYWALPYLAYFSGGILDADSEKVIIDSPESREGLKFYKELRTVYHAAPEKSQIGSSTAAQMFLDGKIAFYLSGRWIYPKISEKANFNWSIINFPYGKTPAPCDTSGWAVSKESKHKESAYRFINYIGSEKSMNSLADTGLIIPARINSASRIKEKVFSEVIKNSEKTPVNKNYIKLTDEINAKSGI